MGVRLRQMGAADDTKVGCTKVRSRRRVVPGLGACARLRGLMCESLPWLAESNSVDEGETQWPENHLYQQQR